MMLRRPPTTLVVVLGLVVLMGAAWSVLIGAAWSAVKSRLLQDTAVSQKIPLEEVEPYEEAVVQSQPLMVRDLPLWGAAEPAETTFTVVLPTHKHGFSNPFTVQQWNVLHKYVEEIVIVWDLPIGNAAADMAAALESNLIPVRFVVNETQGSLNNRYLVHSSIRTKFVFQIDDDYLIRPQAILVAFETVQRNPERIVSFHARLRLKRLADGSVKYDTHYPRADVESGHLGMTCAAFVSRELMALYAQEHAIIAYVAKQRNCEDIAMNYVAEKLLRSRVAAVGLSEAAIIGGTTIHMYPRLLDMFKVLGKEGVRADPGLSTTAEHYRKRNECVDDLERLTRLKLDSREPLPAVGWSPYCARPRVCNSPQPGELVYSAERKVWEYSSRSLAKLGATATGFFAPSLHLKNGQPAYLRSIELSESPEE